jgi:hypothetical protein
MPCEAPSTPSKAPPTTCPVAKRSRHCWAGDCTELPEVQSIPRRSPALNALIIAVGIGTREMPTNRAPPSKTGNRNGTRSLWRRVRGLLKERQRLRPGRKAPLWATQYCAHAGASANEIVCHLVPKLVMCTGQPRHRTRASPLCSVTAIMHRTHNFDFLGRPAADVRAAVLENFHQAVAPCCREYARQADEFKALSNARTRPHPSHTGRSTRMPPCDSRPRRLPKSRPTPASLAQRQYAVPWFPLMGR